MTKCIGKIVLAIAACFLIGDPLGGTSEPVRLFVKEVPLKILGKELSVMRSSKLTAHRDILQKRPTDFTSKS
jgi:hypothetical protein